MPAKRKASAKKDSAADVASSAVEAQESTPAATAEEKTVARPRRSAAQKQAALPVSDSGDSDQSPPKGRTARATKKKAPAAQEETESEGEKPSKKVAKAKKAKTKSPKRKAAASDEEGEADAITKTPSSGKKPKKEPVAGTPIPADDGKPFAAAATGTWKLVTWNVASLNACHKKGFASYVDREQPDVLCLQETKINVGDENADLLSASGYQAIYHNCTAQKGYAGTAVFTKVKPLSIQRGFTHPGATIKDDEGRILTVEYKSFYLINAYVPNSGMKLERLKFKQEYDAELLAFVKHLEKTKPVILTGDLNIAPQPLDVYEPETKSKIAGFTPQERADFATWLAAGLVDVHRERNPDAKELYTFWSYRIRGRDTNRGWRLDFFLTTKSLYSQVVDCFVRSSIQGSDHAPVGVVITTK